MKPIKLKCPTVRHTAPEGMTEEQVATLDTVLHHGFWYSFWRLDEADLETLNRDKVILLGVSAKQHPVVFLEPAIARGYAHLYESEQLDLFRDVDTTQLDLIESRRKEQEA